MQLDDSIDYRWIREDNAARFLSAVHEHGLKHASGWRDQTFAGLSQMAVAQKTGISRPTVSALVARARKFLVDRSPDLGTAIDAKRCGVAIGVDFSYGHNRVALSDVHGQLYEPKRPSDYEMAVDELTEADRSLAWAAGRIDKLLREAGVPLADVKTIGVALAGSTDQSTKKLVPDSRPMNVGWQHLSPVEELPDRLDIKVPVHLDNDTNASANAECLWGAAREAANVIYVKLNRSCNSALVIRHEIYRGANGFAGEIAHALVEPYDEGPPAELQEVFSVAALRSQFQTDESVQGLVRRAHSDKDVRGALLHGARVLGRVLVPIIDVVNPERVVIGGKLGYECYPLIASELGDAIRKHDSPAIRAIQGNVVRGQIPGRTALRGAIALALKNTIPTLLADSMPSDASAKSKDKRRQS
jgi:predicted NBD/HSP70 family sugar kinase